MINRYERMSLPSLLRIEYVSLEYVTGCLLCVYRVRVLLLLVFKEGFGARRKKRRRRRRKGISNLATDKQH